MEFAFINEIRKMFPEYIGDDCAVIEPNLGNLLLTVDDVIEGIHFKIPPLSLTDIGYRAVSAACSDIAASGGKLFGVLISLSLPRGFQEAHIRELYDGIALFCRPLRCKILGGNITSSDSGLHITTTALGFAHKPKLRSHAKIGERIYITGTLGGARAGLELIYNQIGETEISELERKLLTIRHRRPRSRIEAGELARKFLIGAMIDISDGLIADLQHILKESNIGAQVFLDRIPLFPGTEKIAHAKSEEPAIFAATSGEEFELLFTATPDVAIDFAKALDLGLDIPIVEIGEIVEEKQLKVFFNSKLVSPDNLRGWEHNF